MISPLRYPGGKSILYDKVVKFINTNGLRQKTYTEPYSGGFGIGVKLLLCGAVENVIINDFDQCVYAFWKSLFFNTDRLVKLINETEINIENWRKQKNIYNNYKNFTELEVGFATLFLNRTNYSGVLKGGPIGGLEQKGKYKIDCRFNKERIIKIIRALAEKKDKVEIFNLDAIALIEKLKKQESEIFYYFDPPYVAKGKELYTNYYKDQDHENLATRIHATTAKWIMTYDNCDLIKKLYERYNPQEFSLRYSAGQAKTGSELFISNVKTEEF